MKNFEIIKEGYNITLIVSGRLDTLTAGNLDSETQNLITTDEQKLTIDLTNLGYTCSSGLRCFVSLFNQAKAAGAEFKMIGVQPAVREIFDITCVSKIFGL